MLRSLSSGLRAVLRNPGLVALTLAAELGLLLLAGWALRPRPLALAAACLLVESFLDGGLLGAFRAPEAGWTLRGFLRGCSFYSLRLVRISLLAAGVATPFLLSARPLTWGAPTLNGTLAVPARGLALLLALACVHAVCAYARVILVSEERRSAVLALVSSLGFCARNGWALGGQYLVVLAAGWLLALGLAGGGEAAMRAADAARLGVLAALAVGLRLVLLAAQAALHQARGR